MTISAYGVTEEDRLNNPLLQTDANASVNHQIYYLNRIQELGIVTPEQAQGLEQGTGRLSPQQLAQVSLGFATGEINIPNHGPGRVDGANAERANPSHSLNAVNAYLAEPGHQLSDLDPSGKLSNQQVAQKISDGIYSYHKNEINDEFTKINQDPNLSPAQRAEQTQALLVKMQATGMSYADLGDPEAVKQKMKENLGNTPGAQEPGVQAYNQNLLSGVDDRPPAGTKWKKEQDCVQAFVNGQGGSFLAEYNSGSFDNGVQARDVAQSADVRATYDKLMSGATVASIKSEATIPAPTSLEVERGTTFAAKVQP